MSWIEITDLSAVAEDYREAFAKAQQKLNAVLAKQAPMPARMQGRMINGVLIDASTKKMDGPQGILGRAGPTHIRTNSGIPIKGMMQFDNDDLGRLRDKGELEDVILHEMFHVLGAGTLWIHKNLLTGPNTDDPQFVGRNAVAEYHTLLGHTNTNSIPVANKGGPGTKNGHWRETTFGTELNTGFLNGKHRPLSRMSIAALSDLGYMSPVLEEADPYRLPSNEELTALVSPEQCCSTIIRPHFHVVMS